MAEISANLSENRHAPHTGLRTVAWALGGIGVVKITVGAAFCRPRVATRRVVTVACGTKLQSSSAACSPP